MASIPVSRETEDSLATMSLTSLTQNDDGIPLQPVTKDADLLNEADFLSDDSSSTPTPSPRPLSKARAKKARKARKQVLSTSQPRHPPLRPANDILSRIRHDPALGVADFIVGYQDRHADVMELPVAEWKGGGDTTDEEFIPQHRILYFRRKGNEKRIWDRKERVDLLFGSGHGDGKEIKKQGDKKIVKNVEAGGELEDGVGRKVKEAITDDDEQHSMDPRKEACVGIKSKSGE